MAESETDRKQDYDDAYNRAWEAWGPLHLACKADHKAYLVNAFTSKDLEKFRQLGVDPLTFPLIRKNVKLIANLQRRNRLGFRFDPVEGSDVETASQLTSGITYAMSRHRGYHVISDAFEGALKTRINLVDAYNDRNFSTKLRRYPYNQFVLDPGFNQRDLSDCSYGITRHKLTTQGAKRLSEGREAAVDRIFRTTKADDSKFPEMSREKAYGDHLLFYDQWQRRVTVSKRYLIVTMGGQQMFWRDDQGNKVEFKGTEEELAQLRFLMPTLDTITLQKETVDVTGYLNGIELFHEVDPWGIGDFSFTPVIAFFDPEYADVKSRLGSLSSILKDSQRMSDKMMNYILSILQFQAWGGMDVEVNALVDPKQAFAGGPFPRVFNDGAISAGKFRDRPSVDIPPGILETWKMLPNFMSEMANLNPEAFGIASSQESRVSGVLAKLRQGQGLVGVFDFMDNLSLAQSVIGIKCRRLIQQWPAEKWRQVLGTEPAQGLFLQEGGQYDCQCVENVLTDTQRGLMYQELLMLKQMGAEMNDPAPVTWAMLLEYAPVAMKGPLMKQVMALEQQNRQQQEQQAKLADAMQQLSMQREQATIESEKSQSLARQMQAREDITDAAQNRVETAAKIDELKNKPILQLVGMAVDLEKEKLRQRNVKENSE